MNIDPMFRLGNTQQKPETDPTSRLLTLCDNLNLNLVWIFVSGVQPTP